MITTSHPATTGPDGRFNVMLAMFAFDSPDAPDGSSILCRVLDGRELDDICPIDHAILTPDERAHYSGLCDRRKRALAFRTRAELKRMLGREIGLPPQQVPMRCDEHGKPRCSHALAANLDFSVAHADACAIIAIGEAQGIGVDVERIIEEDPSDELLDIVFGDDERDQWRTVPEDARRRVFTESWTIKEAALKALGTGLDGSAHDFRVRFTRDGHAQPIFERSNWICERVDFCPCYAASCVVIVPTRENPRRRRAA
jgi:4'-phosphopantetheinyl transferase